MVNLVATLREAAQLWIGYICKYIEIDFISTNVPILPPFYYRSEIGLVIYEHLIVPFYGFHCRESWDGADKNSANREPNPLLAAWKAFVDAFVKFWSDE